MAASPKTAAVEEEPEHGTEANQASRKDQQRLLQTRLGIVIRINAGVAQGKKEGWLAQEFRSGS